SIDRTADESGDLALSILDTTVNAAERTKVSFITTGIDPDVVSATVTFTDSVGHSVTVAATAGTVDLSSLVSGMVDSLLKVIDASGNAASAAGAPIHLDDVNGSAGDDTIVGTAGPDTFNGLGGNDTLLGLGGDDT